MSDKTDLKINQTRRDKEGHFILINGTVNQEDITILTIHAPNLEYPFHIKLLLDLKMQTNIDPLIVSYFNTPLSSIYRSPEQKIEEHQS